MSDTNSKAQQFFEQDTASTDAGAFLSNQSLIAKRATNSDSEIPTEGFQLPESNSPVPVYSKGTISRDEMNLAEFPLTVLSKRADPKIKTLEFSDSIRGKNGELINRAWIITGADKFGLPTSSDDEVLLGLLKLTADDGIRNRKVYFTRYELLRILRWSTEGRSYSRLQNALDRLSGVRIKATNAFYDNEMKLHSTRNFGIIDAYEINDGRDTRPSFFTWSEVLFKSFQVGFIKKLDLDIYTGLQSAVSKRLYRYLDKHFWYKSKIQMNLFTLAHEKIGISRNYAYASSLRQQIDPALDELKERGLISSYDYAGKGKSTEIFIYAASGARKLSGSAGPQEPAAHVVVRNNEQVGELTSLLIQRGIREAQAKRLVSTQPAELHSRMIQIVEYFDMLVRKNSKLISRNPQGFLYRALENPKAFVLPGDKGTTVSAERPQSQEALNLNQRRQTSMGDAERSRNVEGEYLIARRQEIERLKDVTSDQELLNLRKEVEKAFTKLKPIISDQRFNEAINHALEQKLLALSGFPAIEEWRRKTAR